MPDWNDYAIKQANVARKVPQIERSVAHASVPDYSGPVDLAAIKYLRGLGIRVFFGSDGYLRDAAVREEVRSLRRLLGLKQIEELGFALNEHDGRSWALVVRTEEDTELLANLVEAAHATAFYSRCDVPELRSLARRQLEELEIDAEQFLGE
jgi:hypothetical protein